MLLVPKKHPRIESLTMRLQDGFLADIIEHPDDDAPRLIYADWLEENGDQARAQFIRAPCLGAPFMVEEGMFPLSDALSARKLRPTYRQAFLKPFTSLGLLDRTPADAVDED